MNNKPKKLFVTGANGFIGKNFVKYAIKHKYYVFAVSRKKMKSNNKNLVWLQGEFSETRWKKELKNSDVLVHLASAGVIDKKVEKSYAYFVNVTKSIKLLKNAISSNCLNWVIAGSASEYGEVLKNKKPVSSITIPMPQKHYDSTKYIFSKKAIELNNQNNSIKCRIMRIFPVYGNGENKKRLFPSLMKAATNNDDFTINNYNSINDFTPVEQVVKDLLQACNFNKKNSHFPQIWHISSGLRITVKQFAEMIWKKTKSKGKLSFLRTEDDKIYHHFSDKKSIWKS